VDAIEALLLFGLALVILFSLDLVLSLALGIPL
jgi:hypothetical protein